MPALHGEPGIHRAQHTLIPDRPEDFQTTYSQLLRSAVHRHSTEDNRDVRQNHKPPIFPSEHLRKVYDVDCPDLHGWGRLCSNRDNAPASCITENPGLEDLTASSHET